jgi:hypothetical protein
VLGGQPFRIRQAQRPWLDRDGFDRMDQLAWRIPQIDPHVIGAALAQDASSASAISHPARMCLLP